MEIKDETFEVKVIRRLSNLEQHIINLIVPVQYLTNLLKSDDYIKDLIIIQQTPIQIDDRGLRTVLREFYEKFDNYENFVKEFSSEKTLSEIKYIGKRLNEIEGMLENIKEKGIKKNVELNFRCDGYELVQKPLSYDVTEPKAEKIDSEKKTKDLLKTLNDKESSVLIHTYGLLNAKKKTPKEIAKMFNQKSSEQIRKIKLKAIYKCRHKSRNKFVKFIDNEELKADIGIDDCDIY